MARAIAVGHTYAMYGRRHNKSINIGKPGRLRPTQRAEARRMAESASVDFNYPCGKAEAEQFARALGINLNVFEFQHTFNEVLYYTVPIDGRLEVDLLFNSETKFYDCITDIDALLQSVRNHQRVYCRRCRRIKYNTNYRCSGLNDRNKYRYVIHSQTVFHNYDYSLLSKDTDFH